MKEELNKSRIAKNTLLLYFRLLLTIAVGLFTSRVVLDKLGVDDFGIYNVVGGIVSMLSFLNSAMIVASQRFLSYELGRADEDNLKKVFNTSVLIHLLIAGIIFVLAETIGLWFVNHYLNIDESRIFAANIVYQSSIGIFILTILAVPFNSCVIAHEKMNMFAYLSIVEYLLKLGICFLISVTFFDRLIVYGVLLLGVSIIVSSTYVIYCRKHFAESKLTLKYDKEMFKEMFSFAGWNLFGNIGSSFKDQVINIILNIFCGTRVNAARGIAVQVNGIINTFASNIAMAINPQITKQYAAGNIDQSKGLVFACARYSFYLLTLIAVPFILNIDQLLDLWLVEVPEYTSQFLLIAIFVSMIYTLTGSVSTAIQATGKVKTFQIGVCIIMVAEIPLTYLLLKMGYSPVIAIYPTLITNTLSLVYRYILIHKYLVAYGWKEYVFGILFRALFVFTISFAISFLTRQCLPNNPIGTLTSIIQSILTVALVVITIGITPKERDNIYSVIKKRIK